MRNLERINTYLEEISEYKRLHTCSRSNEASVLEIIRNNQAGADEIRKNLVLSNLGLVVYVARKYEGNGLCLEDLVQEGNLGLIKASEDSRWTLEYGFTSWAYLHIKGAILRALAEKSRLIRIPIHKSEKKGIDNDTSQVITNISNNINKNLSSFDEDPCILEKEISRMINQLEERQKDIIIKHYGINGDKPQSYIEIGKEMNLSAERVRQIAKDALEKIRLTNSQEENEFCKA